MTAEKWRLAWDLYQDISDVPATERNARLQRCTADPEVIAEVLYLLEAGASAPSEHAESAHRFPAPGETYSRYLITGWLGRGGMGEVFSAYDPELDRDVALKFLNPERGASKSATERFIREAKAASALNHPNIVTIHEVIHAEDSLAIAMELIKGDPLRTLCGSPQSPAQVISWGRQIAGALSAARQKGIIHRDLKPENIMVRDDGLIKILDFGLARHLGGDNSTSTAGLPVGTLRYMSPEQTRGAPLGPGTDVFALGIVLYELLTGRHPFGAGSAFAIVHGIEAVHPRSPSDLNPAVSEALDELVLNMLAKQPEARPRAEQVAATLASIQPEEAAGRLARRSRRTLRRLTGRLQNKVTAYAIAFSVAAIVLAVGAVRYLTRPEPVLMTVPFTSLAGELVTPSFAPDGRSVTFAWRSSPRTPYSVCTKPIQQGRQTCFTAPDESAFSPAWSPDGKQIAFLSGKWGSKNGLYVRDLPSGAIRKIMDIAPGDWQASRSLAWMPKSRGLIITQNRSLYLIGLPRGDIRRLTYPPEYGSDVFPAVSSDGEIVFTRSWRGAAALYVMRPQISEPPKRLVFPQLAKRISIAATWLPNRRELLAACNGPGEIWQIPLEGGQPVLLLRIPYDVTDVSVSRDKRQLLYSESRSDTNLWTLNLAGGASQPELLAALASTRDEYDPQYSPDGTKIAFESNRSGTGEIYVSSRSGADPVQLTHFGGPMTGSPFWSPDGKWLTFDSRVNGLGTVFVIPSSGGEPKAITGSEGPNVVPSWSHDGAWIYFGSSRTGTMQVWRVRPDGRNPEQLTRRGGFAPLESPDGEFVYYVRSRNADDGLWRMSLRAREETEVLPRVLDRAFAITAKNIYFGDPSPDFSSMSYYRLSIGASSPSLLMTVPKPLMFGFAVSPDDSEMMLGFVDRQESALIAVENLRDVL